LTPSTSLGYREALDYLFPRTTAIKFGLDTTRALLEELGNPDRLFPSVHIGGTNGKGSVASLVAGALQAAGWRTGLYTSPHLCSFRERIRVDGDPISEGAVAMWTERLRPLMETLEATFFEATTVMALADFAARGAEIAVLEVGLGGRLDSTNVVTPLVSAVTTLGLDHQKYLGHTLEEVAREKAGISKPGVPFVIGEPDPDRAALLAAAADAGAVVSLVPPEQSWDGPLAMSRPHQRRNASVAHAILQHLPQRYRPGDQVVARAFAATRVAGRYDRRGKWLFDVAHNPEGVATLVRALEADQPPRPVHALVSILGDKQWPEMLVALDRVIDVGILTLAPTAASRGWHPDWLSEWLAQEDRPPAKAEWHLEPDFTRALERAQADAATVVVTGSFHTVGDVMQVMGLNELSD